MLRFFYKPLLITTINART